MKKKSFKIQMEDWALEEAQMDPRQFFEEEAAHSGNEEEEEEIEDGFDEYEEDETSSSTLISQSQSQSQSQSSQSQRPIGSVVQTRYKRFFSRRERDQMRATSSSRKRVRVAPDVVISPPVPIPAPIPAPVVVPERLTPEILREMKLQDFELFLQEQGHEEIITILHALTPLSNVQQPHLSTTCIERECTKWFPAHLGTSVMDIESQFTLYKLMYLKLLIFAQESPMWRDDEKKNEAEQLFSICIERIRIIAKRRQNDARMYQTFSSVFRSKYSLIPRSSLDKMTDEMTDFQKTLDIVSFNLHQDKLRIRNGTLYCPIFEDGHFRGTYARYKTLQKYVSGLARTPLCELQPFLVATPKMPENVINNLIDGMNCGLLPEYDPHPRIITFKNGWWDGRQAPPKFYQWHEQKLDDVAIKYFSEDCHILPEVFETPFFKDDLSFYERKETDEEDIDPEQYDWYIHIPTPAIDSIFDLQIMTDEEAARSGQDIPKSARCEDAEDVKRFIYAMLGRMFFEIGECDNLQKFMFFEGESGTGKSTILNLFSKIFSQDFIFNLSSNTEKQFGLYNAVGKRIIIMPEVTKDFAMPLAEFLSLVSGEWMSAAVKHKRRTVDLKPRAHILGAGNNFRAFPDHRGAIKRRLIPVMFTVNPSPPNPSLSRHCESELPMFIMKCITAYFAFLEWRQDRGLNSKDFDSICPEYFRACAKVFSGEVDPLQQFLDEGPFQLDPEGLYPLKEFQEKFREFCRLRRMKQKTWHHSLYTNPFKERNLTLTSRIRYGNGLRGKCIKGLTSNEPSLDDDDGPSFV